MVFQGLKPPVGKGLLIEVHLDLTDPTEFFKSSLRVIGFEDDPFSLFNPPGYNYHMTGRVRVQAKRLHSTLPDIRHTVAQVIRCAQNNHEGGMYAEIELVKNTTYFQASLRPRMIKSLEQFGFIRTKRYGEAKADVHVEFPAGQVSDAIREYLVGKQFYWVATPQTKDFGPEQIATLQTTSIASAQQIYRALCEHPLPGCTGIHLEQKLGMIASDPGLPLPEVIAVQGPF